MPEPVIGITADADERTYKSARSYARMIVLAGGTPIILPHRLERLDDYLRLCAGFVLSGGDDPRMEEFGQPTDPRATPLDPERQAFEVALIRAIRPDRPTLGVCLGMQLMALVAGGDLDQHLPESLPTHEQHWGQRIHSVQGSIGCGEVLSHHRQAVSAAGSLEVTGKSPDGVIEAVRDPRCGFFVGVQWHPERTTDRLLGIGLFERLVKACRE